VNTSIGRAVQDNFSPTLRRETPTLFGSGNEECREPQEPAIGGENAVYCTSIGGENAVCREFNLSSIVPLAPSVV